MSQDKQYAERFQDLLNINVNVSSQEVNHQNTANCLALENMNSLALFPRQSIEKIIPLSKNMLSEDMYMKQSISSEQQIIKQEKPYKSIILENEQEWLVDQLDLPKTMKNKKLPENTKNVLRNFGNAQNQYALYNKQANKVVQDEITHPQAFYKWVRQLKLQNFEGFKNVWANTESHNKVFVRVYKKICWLFYLQTAIPYVLTSRMRDSKTKVSHLKYLYRFLEGLQDPNSFNYFKKVQK